MSSNGYTLNLPVSYEPVVLDRVDSAVEEAKRRARDGAEEGTLVWARQQTAPQGEAHRQLGNLHCALVLRPEQPLAQALQLNYVAVVALGATLAEFLSPRVDLRFEWPNELLLNASRGAAFDLQFPANSPGVPDWLILGLTVYLAKSPDERRFVTTSMANEGCAGVGSAEVLELYCRHFLAWINRWAEDGFAPVRKAWETRTDLGKPVEMTLRGESLSGAQDGLADNGDLVLRSKHGLRRIPLADWFSGSA